MSIRDVIFCGKLYTVPIYCLIPYWMRFTIILRDGYLSLVRKDIQYSKQQLEQELK